MVKSLSLICLHVVAIISFSGIVSAQLENYHYYVRNLAQTAGFIGRSYEEDSTSNPKGIFALPSNVVAPTFAVETLANGKYHLYQRAAPVVGINSKVYALLTSGATSESWKITRRPDQGYGVYTIENHDGTAGWVLTSTATYTQVQLQPLTVIPNSPGHYPQNQLWEIEPAD